METQDQANDQAQDATEVDGTPKRSKSEQLRHYKPNYESYQLGNGNLSMDNGDDVAQILRGASPETVMRAAEKLQGLEPGHLAERYKDRNNGAKRMNAGNQIRAFYKRGDKTVAEIRKVIKESNKEVMTAS